MGFSPLANMSLRIPDQGRSSLRQYAVSGLGLHHNAGVDAWREASNPNRQVSANYWIANDGTIIPNIDEARRAWTSGAIGYPAGANADHRNITVEVSNSPEGVQSGTWAISDVAMKSLIELIADVFRRYGLGPVTRGANRGVGVHQDWVPTACPGPYIMENLPHIIVAAEALRSGGSSSGGDAEEEDEDMSRPMTMAKVVKGNEVEVTTSWPETGEERVFTSTNTPEGQSYNRNVALAYGCAPQMPIIYITASHYDKVKAENKARRER